MGPSFRSAGPGLPVTRNGARSVVQGSQQNDRMPRTDEDTRAGRTAMSARSGGRLLILAGVLLCVGVPARAEEPAWTRAADTKAPMTPAEARAFMKRLTEYVLKHHLRRDESAPQ